MRQVTIISAAVLMFISSAAVAQTQNNDNTAINATDVEQTQVQLVNVESTPVDNTNTGSSTNDNASSASSRSHNSLSNAGNASVNVEGDDFPASSAIAPSINPTSPCMGSSAAGGQGMSFGVSIGSSWRDKECEKREAFRMGMESGHPEVTAMALEVYRNLEAVRDALGAGESAEQAQTVRPGVPTYNSAMAGVGRVLP